MSNSEFWNQRFEADAERHPDGNPDGHDVFAGEPNPILRELIDPLTPKTPKNRAIDVGSGRGRHVVWLARNGWDTTAFDFSDVGLAHTRQALGAEGLAATLQHGDITTWNPEQDSYDLIVCAYIHLLPEERARLWSVVRTAIAPGGHVAIIAHHHDNKGHGPGNPKVLYDAGEVASALGDGFVVKQKQRLERGAGAVDAVVFAERVE
ncbi:class I SAM-dependent methyltransferase [Corynebacterium sp. H78]|uniref:class I SAM-dependent methyltransferase n=1 Tax=Corynebacterium sp. H78 TaxID=3133417 RepID=UPI0030A676FB